jgi:hypothetical protein
MKKLKRGHLANEIWAKINLTSSIAATRERAG